MWLTECFNYLVCGSPLQSQWRHSSNYGIYVNSQFVEDVIGAFHVSRLSCMIGWLFCCLFDPFIVCFVLFDVYQSLVLKMFPTQVVKMSVNHNTVFLKTITTKLFPLLDSDHSQSASVLSFGTGHYKEQNPGAFVFGILSDWRSWC